jgi:hypothetical protein
MARMSSAPVIHWLRPGVGFTPRAAASFARVEAALGRHVQTNSTYRDYDKQMGMYRAWNAYANGTGPRPPHSRAVHPDYSIHCRGEAVDTNEWTSPAFRALMADHGWIRTAAWDPTEQHHFEYQVQYDRHLNDPAPTSEEDELDKAEKKKFNEMYDWLNEVVNLARQTHTRSGNASRDITKVLKIVGSLPGASDEFAKQIADGIVVAIDDSDRPLEGLSDKDITRIATAAADERDKRERARLSK